MSRFTSGEINGISPYVPGEQPRDKKYIKLNTNENPYYASPEAVKRISANVLENLNRYSDPECTELTGEIAKYYGVSAENVLVTNGSDEALAFAFYAYGKCGVCFPDVTYGFYNVIAELYGCPVERVDVESDFTIDAVQFYNKKKTVVLANPNAQTGIEMSAANLIGIIENNTDNIVICDQAYADFGTYNAIELINRYKNLVVANTFSKSRSLAGARVGFVVADKDLIDDLKKVKNSFHPYNVNSVSAALAAEAIKDDGYFKDSVNSVKRGRGRLTCGLEALGFEVLPSAANFVLARHGALDGEKLYLALKERGVLVRHFSDKKIADFVRITVGTDDEIEKFLKITECIIAEKSK